MSSAFQWKVKEKNTAIKIKVKPKNGMNKMQSNDLIDEDLQSALKPLNIMQAICFCAKYKIQDGVIRSNSLRYKVFSFIGTLFILALIIATYFRMIVFRTERILNFLIDFGQVYEISSSTMGLILNYYGNMTSEHFNVSLVKKIQNVHRVLKINGRKYVKRNWFSFIATNMCYFLYFVYFTYVFSLAYVNIVVSYYTLIVFDWNIVYATRILDILCSSLKVWIKGVKRSFFVGNLENECYWKDMYQTFMEILDAYQLVEKTFDKQILFCTINLFMYALLDISKFVQLTLLTTFSTLDFFLMLLIFVWWIVKNMLLLIFLSVQCEAMYETMKEVQQECCLRIKSKRCSDKQKRIFKNIQRALKANFRKFNACGLYVIDAALMVNYFSLITTYLVVILQFLFK